MEHYFDSLPVHPQPLPLESFTSYLIRLAESNRITFAKAWAAVLFPHRKQGIRREAADLLPLSFGALPILARCTEEQLRATTLFHVGQKFGRSTLPQHLGRFLNGSIAPYLRYCPACIAEQGFYSLVWRFLNIQGCPTHADNLLDECPHCENRVPLFASPLKIGVCSVCDGDLSQGNAVALTSAELQLVDVQIQDIKFLLQPNPIKSESKQLLLYIGKQFVQARQARKQTRLEIAEILQIKIDEVAGIEVGAVQTRGATLQAYIRYAAYLELTLSDIFTHASQEHEASRCLLKGSFPTTHHPLGEWRERKVLAQVQHAERILRAKNALVTPRAISDMVQIAVADMRYYPAVRTFLNTIVIEQWTKTNPLSSYSQREQQLITRVLEAIELLTAQGEAVTHVAVADMVGMSRAGLTYYPCIRTLLEQICTTSPSRRELANSTVEDDLMSKVRHAIEELEGQGGTVTQVAVSDYLQKPLSSLRYYPRVRVLLECLATLCREARVAEGAGRETTVLVQVQQAVDQLRSHNQPVSQSAVAELVGIALPTLRRYRTVRSVLQQLAAPRRSDNANNREQRQAELMHEVSQAIKELEARAQPVTQLAISVIVGMSPAGLRRYPHVRAMLTSLPSAINKK